MVSRFYFFSFFLLFLFPFPSFFRVLLLSFDKGESSVWTNWSSAADEFVKLSDADAAALGLPQTATERVAEWRNGVSPA